MLPPSGTPTAAWMATVPWSASPAHIIPPQTTKIRSPSSGVAFLRLYVAPTALAPPGTYAPPPRPAPVRPLRPCAAPRDLARACLDADPRRRPSAAELVSRLAAMGQLAAMRG